MTINHIKRHLAFIALSIAQVISFALIEKNLDKKEAYKYEYNINAACIFVNLIILFNTPEIDSNFINKSQYITVVLSSKDSIRYLYSNKGILLKFTVTNNKSIIEDIDIDGTLIPDYFRHEKYLKSYILNGSSKNFDGNINFECDSSEISIKFEDGFVSRIKVAISSSVN